MHVCGGRLFSALLVLVCITDMLGYMLMVSTFISHHQFLLARFTPMVYSIIILNTVKLSVAISGIMPSNRLAKFFKGYP